MKRLASGWARLGLAAVALAAALARGEGEARAHQLTGDAERAARARDRTMELDTPAARVVLEGASPDDQLLAVERARALLYEGDCDGAAAILARADLAASNEGAELGDIARGCARATAATVIERDEQHGVVVRLQDDEDRALVPFMAEVAGRARELLAKDLGVTLPRPIWIDLVRDQFTLAAMTGLPEEAARTTGTVAVAKWGRVTMISPRATHDGYPWMDTLVHELTHLALTRGTRDKAPLWLQEGVAKREETRWRDPQPLDDLPHPDAVASLGFDRGLGRPIDKLGPSIAMLPSPEHAQVAFAEVASFIRFWAGEAGVDALPRLVARIKETDRPDDVDKAIAEVSSADFATWDQRWRAHLAAAKHDVPAELAPGAAMPGLAEISKRVRLGSLLAGRKHYAAAAIEQARAQSLAPHEPVLRCMLAASLLGSGDRANAAPLVEKVEDVHSRYGRWWSLHGLLHATASTPALDPFHLGIAIDPLDADVACEEKGAPELPENLLRRALCEAARRVPR